MADTNHDFRPTPSVNASLPLKLSGFETIVDALEYAARGDTGLNFFNLRGELVASLSYAALAERAKALGARLAGRFARGECMALVAETGPQFITTFFACQYAGLVPAPMPLPVNFGGKEGYLGQIRQMVAGSRAAAAIGPSELAEFLADAVEGLDEVAVLTFDDLDALPAAPAAMAPFGRDELCYIQYSSGSTSAPKGVIGTQASVTANLHGITAHGLALQPDDRAASWLPLYHDMGLIGFMLAPMFGQRSVDYLETSDFVRRPLLWLRIISDYGATITYSPSFGYELAARRSARAEDGAINLSRVRIAGIGGDMVRPEALSAFARAFEPNGFASSAFLPSYGMAESTLAIAFSRIGDPLEIDYVDMRHFNRSGIAQPASALTSPEQQRGFIVCGAALPGHEIEVRDAEGQALADRAVGRIFIKGPSLTPGYFSDAGATDAMYHGEWLDTGDMGYALAGRIVITGRAKDLIIINGRNIWPQDIEWAVEKLGPVRQGGVAAFSVDNGMGERVVVVVERRGGMSADAMTELSRDIARTVQTAAGVPAEIILAKPHSMVMTSSGKLSRAKVRDKYLSGAFDDAMAEAAAPAALAEARV